MSIGPLTDEGIYTLERDCGRFLILNVDGEQMCRVNDEATANAVLAYLRGETNELPQPALKRAA